MTIKDVIDKLIENWKTALTKDYVIYPLSFALYETWKWADSTETGRKRNDNQNKKK